MPPDSRQLSDRGERKPPPGRYAQGKRSPITWVLLCDVCAGFALNVDESYNGYLSGRCQGCGCQAPELHRFVAYISTAEGCDAHSGACAGRHPRVFGDVRAYGGDEADRLRAERDRLREALTRLTDHHHRTLVGSDVHDPERRDWRECPAASCSVARSALAPDEATR